jgi:hypothetical protein
MKAGQQGDQAVVGVEPFIRADKAGFVFLDVDGRPDILDHGDRTAVVFGGFIEFALPGQGIPQL